MFAVLDLQSDDALRQVSPNRNGTTEHPAVG
jgi:hypothetical protein